MKKMYLFLPCIGIVVLSIFLFYLLTTSTTSHISSVIKTSIQTSLRDMNHSGIDHIVIIMMENKAYSDIVGNQNAPYINSLIPKYSFADNYFAISHPSLPNYIAILGGDTFGITSDCSDCFISSNNLLDQLESAHKTWKAYMESMPNSCFMGSASPYEQKHNPFIYFDDIRNNQKRCQNIVPYTQITTDLQSVKTTPNFIWISPNLCHDMHDCSTTTGDTWLSEQVPLILDSPAFRQQHALLIITWDEGEGSGDNKIPTLFIGNSVKKHFISHTPYTHYSLLHTIEKIWNMPSLTTNVTKSAVMTDMLKESD